MRPQHIEGIDRVAGDVFELVAAQHVIVGKQTVFGPQHAGIVNETSQPQFHNRTLVVPQVGGYAHGQHAGMQALTLRVLRARGSHPQRDEQIQIFSRVRQRPLGQRRERRHVGPAALVERMKYVVQLLGRGIQLLHHVSGELPIEQRSAGFGDPQSERRILGRQAQHLAAGDRDIDLPTERGLQRPGSNRPRRQRFGSLAARSVLFDASLSHLGFTERRRSAPHSRLAVPRAPEDGIRRAPTLRTPRRTERRSRRTSKSHRLR